jgi:molybdenum cofactor cytidylyltransferase
MITNLSAIILAAGSSRRFGKQKLCEKLPCGNTVLSETIFRVERAISEVRIITSANVYASLHDKSGRIKVCPEANLGMGLTLAYGIKLVQSANACLVCLADMPFVKTTTYQTLAKSLTASNIVVPVFDGKQGNPVGFGKRFFKNLMMLNEDSGGRSLLQTHADAIQRIDVDDPAILYDIDTPEDLEKYAHINYQFD